jgi:hypothetical protein
MASFDTFIFTGQNASLRAIVHQSVAASASVSDPIPWTTFLPGRRYRTDLGEVLPLSSVSESRITALFQTLPPPISPLPEPLQILSANDPDFEGFTFP